MKKFLEILTNKVVLKVVAIVVALIVCASSTIGIMTTSYGDWKEYYDAIMHQKYLDSLPLAFEGISAKQSEAVEYFADGTAIPAKEDFIVTAHYTEKGKKFDEILDSTAYTMTVPEDFSENGGEISFSYTYQPEATEEDENGDPITPDPIIKTATVDVELTKVVLKTLVVKEMPYRVYYSDAMAFDPEGMTLEAEYNNGWTVDVDPSKVKVETTGNLKAGDEKAVVSYELGGVKLTADVPVKVDAASKYQDGDIMRLKAEGQSFVLQGESMSTARPTVRAYYSNGNRLLLDESAYSVSGNVPTGDFLKNCIATISLKANPLVYCRTAVQVRYGAEAEESNPTGGTVAQVVEYVKDGETYVQSGKVGVVNALSNGTKMTFTFNSTAVVKGDLCLRVANDGTSDIMLMDVATVKVNGATMAVPTTSKILGRPNGEVGYVFNDCALASLLLKKGTNVVEITFNDLINKNFAVDCLTFSTQYYGQFFSSMDEFLVDGIENATTPEFNITKTIDFHTVSNGTYGHGICTDGTYVYVIRTAWASSARNATVVKYDPATGSQVAVSPTLAKDTYSITEATAGITYLNGKVIVYGSDGKEWAIDSALTGGTWTEYTDFKFENLDDSAVLTDVYFSVTQQKYAVSSGNQLHIYDAVKKEVATVGFRSETGGLKLARMSGSNSYIYVVWMKDGVHQPVVHLYDWNGEFVGRVVVPVTADVLGVPTTSSVNVQGIVAFNDDLFFTVSRWGGSGSDSGAIIKASFPKVGEKLTIKLTMGEYVQAGVDDSTIQTSITVAPVSGSTGAINKSAAGYAMGGVSDGEYMYIALNGGANVSAAVQKVEISTNTVVATSKWFTVSSNTSIGDNARLFIKDDVLYCVVTGGKIFATNLATFVEGAVFVETTLDNVDDVYGAKDIAWDETSGRYAIMSPTALYIVAEDGTVLKSGIGLAYDGMKASSVTADEKYIYVNYTTNNKTSYPVDVFTWDGAKIATTTLSGFTLGNKSETVKYNFNVQAMFIHNDEIYLSLCSWDDGMNKYYLWKATCDHTVLP